MAKTKTRKAKDEFILKTPLSFNDLVQVHSDIAPTFNDAWELGRENERYMRGKHWRDDQEAEIRGQNRLPYSFTLIANKINTIVATYGSGIVPYNGTYNNQSTTSCDLDSSYITPLGLTTAVDNVTTGQEIFTPDITHTSTVSSLDAFKTKWVPYVTGLTTFSPVITNPIPLLTATPDPTAPLVMLNETPIQPTCKSWRICAFVNDCYLYCSLHNDEHL